jgi:hypothetical protein
MRTKRKKVTTLKPIPTRDKWNIVIYISFPYHKNFTGKVRTKVKTCDKNVLYHSRGNLRNIIGNKKSKEGN